MSATRHPCSISGRAIYFAAVFAVFLATGLVHDALTAEGQEAPWPRELPGPGANGVDFVPDDDCAGCHQAQSAAWRTSHHFQAMAEASDATVLADFDDAVFTHESGRVTRFFRRDGGFFVNTEGPDGALADFEVLYTFGVDPLQQYLIPLPGGRLQAFTIAWDPAAERWFDLYPGQATGPGDPLHWSGRLFNWNGRCAECHSTNLRTRYDLATDTYQTAWSGITVGCQSCHGPGGAHVAWARQDGAADSGMGLVVDYDTIGPVGEVETCARCHSRRHRITVDDRHGRPFLDDFVPALLRADLYHPDGQVLDEVYVYGSFVQSRMYRAGVTCSNCHDAHTGRLVADGNAVCTQCHREQPPEEFPSLRAGLYDSSGHHFHAAGSPGALCANCHMPARTYMVVDPRRDHSLRIPSPALSLAIGTPNACTGCHVDRTDGWAAERVAQWYGAGGRRAPHYGAVLAAGRRGGPGAAGLAALAGESEVPAMVRATALDLLPRFGADGAAAIVAGLKDPDALVRAAAARGLAIGSVEERLPLLFPLLSDPVRAVRIEAARLLAPIPARRMEDRLRQPFEAALAEYVAAQTASDETPEAHLNLGRLYVSQGRPARAEAEFATAIALAPEFVPARLSLANLYNAQGRNDEAETALRTAIRIDPESGDAQYSLGLLLAEIGRLDEAAMALAAAARRMPDVPRVHYNLALALQRSGRMDDAESAFLTAKRLSPQDPETIQALAIFYTLRQDWDKAVRNATELVRLVPDDPGPRELLRQIQRLRGG